MNDSEKIELLKSKGLTENEIDQVLSTTIINSEQPDIWSHLIKEVKSVLSDFIRSKYKHDSTGQWLFVGLVTIILVCVSLLSFSKILTSEATATLLASVIGYSVGKYQQKINGNSSE